MNLTDILSPETIVVGMPPAEKTEIIRQLVGVLHKAGKIRDFEKALKAILDREAVMSTGVGEGVAIPHGKSEAAPSIVAALGITSEPIDFDAIDRNPVQLIWLLIGPPGQTGPHLKALSRISRLMHRSDFRDRLIAAPDSQAVLQEIEKQEQNLF